MDLHGMLPSLPFTRHRESFPVNFSFLFPQRAVEYMEQLPSHAVLLLIYRSVESQQIPAGESVFRLTAWIFRANALSIILQIRARNANFSPSECHHG